MGLARVREELARQEEEKRKAEEARRALELYRAQERQSQQPPQGPPPRPKPLPSPWERPTFAPPISAPAAPSPMQMQSPGVNTGTPSIGSSQQDSPTVQLPQQGPQMPSVQPRPMNPALRVSLSDRLRGSYQEPLPNPWQAPTFGNKGRTDTSGVTRDQIVAAQPEPIEQRIGGALQQGWDQFTGMFQGGGNPQGARQQQPQPQRTWPSPDILRGEYNRPNRPMVPTDARPFGSEPVYPQGFNPIQAGLEAWTNTPEYKWAQARAEDRQNYEPETHEEYLAKRTQEVGGVEIPPTVSDQAWAGLATALNNFAPSRQVLARGQDALDFVFSAPQLALANTPLPGGYSVSELVTPATTELSQMLNPFSEDWSWKRTLQMLAETTVGTNTRYADSLKATQEARKLVADAIAKTGNPDLNIALRPIAAGTYQKERVENVIDFMLNKEQNVEELRRRAVEIQAGDPVQAGEYFRQAQELEEMTLAEAVDRELDPWSEFGYTLPDPTDPLVTPIASAIRLLPEARALARAGKQVNVDTATASERLAKAAQQGTRLAEAVGQGRQAAKPVYDEIISPWQGPVEKIDTNPWMRWALRNATPGAVASKDSERLGGAVTGVFNGIVEKSDYQKILPVLIDRPQDLLVGVPGLSRDTVARLGDGDGLVRWSSALGGTDTVRRVPLLKTVENELLGMRSIQGTGKVDPVEFQAELKEILYNGSRRINGYDRSAKLPFGAKTVNLEITGADAARVVYKDAAGKIIHSTPEASLSEARRTLSGIQGDVSGRFRKRDAPVSVLRTIANVQRYVMNDVWLITRPANWIGNALSASVGLFAHNAYTTLPTDEILDWTSTIYGGFAPTPRVLNVVPGTDDIVKTARDEVGGSAIGWVASKLTGTPDNRVTQFMKGVQEIPYGNSRIKLPGGIEIPVGEENLALRANYVPSKRAYEGALDMSGTQTLAPRINAIEGLEPDVAKRWTERIVYHAKTKGKGGVRAAVQGEVGKVVVKPTLHELGIPKELISLKGARDIERMLSDAAPSQAGEVAREITRIFNEEKARAASVLTLDPGAPGFRDWTDADLATEAGWWADTMTDDMVKGGMDLATAKQQATELATGFLQEQRSAFDRIVQDLAPASTNPGAWDVITDFYLDYMRAKNQAREMVNVAGRQARELNTAEAWAEKWRVTQQTYDGLRKQLPGLVEQSRLGLQDVLNGGSYQARNDWFEAVESYMRWDDEAFARIRGHDLGGMEDDLWEEYIQRNRDYLDNAQHELFHTFQMYPTVENFDIVRNSIQRIEVMGAQTAFEVGELRKLRATGELSQGKYNLLRNGKWNRFFDDAVELNGILSKIIVRNGLASETASGLRWAHEGVTYELVGPSEIRGKWKARNTETDAIEEFSVATGTDERTPFTVPKNVVDDFNRLSGNDAELDKAADEVLQQMAESRPERVTPANGAPTDEDYLSLGDGAPPAVRPIPTVPEGIVPPRTIPADEITPIEEVWREPDVEQGLPGYNSAGLRRAEPLPQDIPAAGPMPDNVVRPIPDDPDAPGFVPQPDVSPAIQNVVEDVPPVAIPTNDDIRAAASDAGIATATKAGKPTDKHLVSSLNKRLGIKVKNLDELTDEQRADAIAAMQARSEEAVSRMSPAEAKKATAESAPSTVGTGSAPTFGEGARSSKPTTESMFADTGEDLPLVSGAAPRVKDKGAFKPEVSGGQEGMFDMRPQMGGKEPSYKPRVPKQPSVTTPGDIAKMDIEGARDTRKAMAAEWDRVAKNEWGLPKLDQVVATYNRGGNVNLNLNAGEVKQFENLYGTTIAGTPINNVDDVQHFLQQYVDLNKQVQQGQATVKSSKQFARMSTRKILEETRQELLDAGLTQTDIDELVAMGEQGRRTVLDTIESIRGVTPEEPGMVAYDSTAPSVSHVLGVQDKADGYNIWRRMLDTNKRTGGNGATTQADVAQVTIENLTDAERIIKSRLPQILAGTPNQLTGAQKLALVDAVTDWLPEVDNAAQMARMVGRDMADFIMLNVEDKKDFDTILTILMPYSFFWRKMPSRIVGAALAKPSLVNRFYQASRALQMENERSGVPQRLEGTLPIPGTDRRVNVGSLLYKYAMGGAGQYITANPFIEDDPTDNKAEKIAKDIQKYTPGFFPTIMFALDVLDGSVDKDYSSTLTSMVRVPFLGLRPTSIYQRATGNMPEGGNWQNMGFGPDEYDPYRARRALGWIAEEEGIDDVLLGFANQVIQNQYDGVDIGTNIDPAMLEDAIALAQRGVKRGAEDQMVGDMSSYVAAAKVSPWTEAEKAQSAGSGQWWASGYDPVTNPDGSQELQKAIIEENPSVTRGWIKGSDAPGIDAQIDQLFAEANATGEWERIYPQIEALQRQKAELTGDPGALPQPQPQAGSTSDILRGSYGDAYKGMNPQEQQDALQEEQTSTFWDEYFALPDDDGSRAQYLRDNPEFVPIYDANEVKKGREVDHWWEEEGATDKKAGSKKGGAAVGTGGSSEGGLAPGSVTRDDFTEEQLDQLYGEYFGFNEIKDWDGQKAWLLENPEFARLEADRAYAKDGEYPWWVDDVFGEGGIPVGGSSRTSQPTSVADVLRRPYTPDDVDSKAGGRALGGGGGRGRGGGGGSNGMPSSAEWDAYFGAEDGGQFLRDNPGFAEKYLRYIRSKDPNADAWWMDGGSGGAGGDWSTNWDEYRAFGEDWQAKKQYMLDNPEFAAYYIEQYGEDAAWWLDEDGTGGGGFSRSYGGYGGGGGGGSPYLGGSSFQYHNARVDPRFFDRSLWQGPQIQPWVPYFDASPGWMQTGRELAPDPIRKWERPRF